MRTLETTLETTLLIRYAESYILYYCEPLEHCVLYYIWCATNKLEVTTPQESPIICYLVYIHPCINSKDSTFTSIIPLSKPSSSLTPLTLHASHSSLTRRLCINGRECVAILDSGITLNLTAQHLVMELGLPIHQMGFPLSLEVARAVMIMPLSKITFNLGLVASWAPHHVWH